ncbi:MAG: hypothetical protein KDC87_01385 [Planctomycetes bacterium]|nr:hypothetical protein [Planctomycetota bacterium]MCB9869605.1 hypothetical protein [Planctomycetota bacterium]MCB9889842.1 hypothetical protein [Planctomycetota bacterium]
MNRLLLVPLALALGAPLAAQAADAASILPAEPLFTMHIDGPAKLRAAFLPTNLGRMFASAEGQDLIAPFTKMLEHIKKGGEAPFDVEAVEKAAYAYTGRMTLAAQLLDEKIDFNDPAPPLFVVAVVLSPDGKTDLEALCAKSREIAAKRLGDRLADLKHGTHTLSYMTADKEPTFCTPFMHKGHAVALVSQDMKKAAEWLFGGEAKPHACSDRIRKASIGVWVNVKRIIKLVETGAAASLGPRWDKLGRHILDATGIKSIDHMEGTYRAVGPAVVSDNVLHFNQNDRGAIEAFISTKPTKTTLVDLLPRAAAAATAIPFDIQPIFNSVKGVFAKLGADAPMTFDGLLEGFKEHYGLRLKEDLIDKFGSGLMSFSMDSEDEPDPMNPASAVRGMCLGFGLRGGAELAKTLDTMLRKDGLHAGRKTTDYKGVQMHMINIMGFVEVNYAVTDSLFLLGIDKDGAKGMRAALDGQVDQAAGKSATPLPAAVMQRLGVLPGKWTGMGWTNVAAQMLSASKQLEMAAGQLPPPLQPLVGMIEKMPKLLKPFKLEHAATLTRNDGSTWTHQSIW